MIVQVSRGEKDSNNVNSILEMGKGEMEFIEGVTVVEIFGSTTQDKFMYGISSQREPTALYLKSLNGGSRLSHGADNSN